MTKILVTITWAAAIGCSSHSGRSVEGSGGLGFADAAAGQAGMPAGGAAGNGGGAAGFGGVATGGAAGNSAGGAGGGLGGAAGIGGVSTGGAAGNPGGGSGGALGGAAGLGGVGTGGTPSGGAGGQGGAAPSCTREVAFDVAGLPTGWLWQSFSMSFGGKCATCAASPCAACSALWWGPAQGGVQHEPGGVVRVVFEPSCGNASKTVSMKTGTCGAEKLCGMQCNNATRPMRMQLDAMGNGYVISKAWRDDPYSCSLGGFNACLFPTLPMGTQAAIPDSQDADLAQTLIGTQFPCS